MASVSSLDKDLRKMRLDKYTPQAANEVRGWIEGILGERLAGGDLLDALKDGVALCKLINLAVPSPGIKFKASAMPFVQMENISLFLKACQMPPLNLQPHDVFLTVDLYEQKDPTQVLQCIGAFSRVANQVQPSRFPTAIGPKSRAGVMSPQGTGTPTVGGGSFGNRARGASTASNTSSAYNQTGRSGAMTPTRTGEVNSGRWSPTKTDKLPTSPNGGTSSWSKKTDEGVTAPAWNIAQYGYMGGASQGNMGIAFGGRRQITSAGPHVPNMAEKEKKRKEQEAEEERLRVQAEEAEHHRRIEREAEEERARIEEEERWAAEERKLKEKAAEEKKRWEEEERRWKQEEERREQEEREAEERLEKETRRSRATSDARLQGQFLSQYQAERGLARRDRSKSPGPSGRVQELERELELARDRERQYERERQERVQFRDRDAAEARDSSSRQKQREPSRSRNRSQSRPRALSHKNSEDSWAADERDYLRKEWSKQNHDDTPPPKPPRNNQYAEEAPPPQPPRGFQHTEEAAPAKPPRPLPEPTAPIRVLKNNTGPSSRPLPDPSVYQSPPQAATTPQSRTDRYLSSNPAPQVAQPQTTYASELGAFDSTAERDAEDRRRAASQTKTKAGGWASKSLLEREMEMERERQKEWEEGQKATAQAAKMGGQTDGVDGIGGGIGGRWDVNQWTGYTGGDGQNRGRTASGLWLLLTYISSYKVMDPGSVIGIALGVAGLAGQVFAGCITTIQFIITARDIHKDQQYLVLRLRLEQERLLSWSESSGLLDYDSESNSKVLESNVFGLHRSTVLDMLVQIKVLFEEFEKRQIRHKRLRAEYEGTENRRFPNERGQKLGSAPEVVLDTHETSVPLSSKKSEYIMNALETWKNTSKSGMKRLRWATFDKHDFEVLLQQFSILNDNMTGLLDTRLQKEIWNTTQDTNRAVLQLHHELADLQQIVKATFAMTTLSLQGQVTSEPPPYQTTHSEKSNASGLETLAQLARFKAFNESIDADAPPDYNTASILKLGDPSAEKVAMKIRRSAITFDSDVSDRASRCEATYLVGGINKRVWIEWKEYEWAPSSTPGPSPLIIDRAQKLAALLHHQPKPAHFRVPHCLGYFDNAEIEKVPKQASDSSSDSEEDEEGEDDDWAFRIGFVFEKPPETKPSTPPVSLLQLLRDTKLSKPSITDRVALAKALANCILYLHSVNWLHKGLRCDNIIFFPHAGHSVQKSHTPVLHYSEPYLSGFDFARPARPGEFTEQPADDVEFSMYRHPSTLNMGPDRPPYRKSFDIYSFGVILVELAYWSSIDRIVARLDAESLQDPGSSIADSEVFDLERARGHPKLVETIRAKLLDDGSLRKLGARMGGVYAEVTRRCLRGGKDLGIEEGEDETGGGVAARLSMKFYEEVVKKLEGIRAFRSVLKCIERLPTGFMKKLKLSALHGHRRNASQSNGHILPQGYLYSHVDASEYFPVSNGDSRNLEGMQQTLKNTLLSARKSRTWRRNALKHNLRRPNYMGISPAILLRIMIKVERVKRKTPSVLGNTRTSNAIMLQTAMSEDSPRTISVKNIEGIRHALRFLSNLPENFLPTFVQRNSALKKFIRGMEPHNTSITGGHAEKPKCDPGIIEQTVNQLQRRGLVTPYLDKLTGFSAGKETSSVDVETLMQQVLVDATNIAALTPQVSGGDGLRNVDTMMLNIHEQSVPKLHKSRKRAVIALEGSSCKPINLGNVGLPQCLFREVPNPFLDKPPNTMEISRGYLFQGLPNSIRGQTAQIDLAVDPSQLQLSSEDAALQMGFLRILIREVFAAVPEICNHAPCTFDSCEYSVDKSFVSLFREAPMLGGPGGQYIAASYQFDDHVESMYFIQIATDLESQKHKRLIIRYCQALEQSRLAEGKLNNWHNVPYPAVSSEEMASLELHLTEKDKNIARRMLVSAIARNTPVRRQRCEDYDTQILFPELQPIQHEFEETQTFEPRPVRYEPIKVSKETAAETHRNKGKQSGRGPNPHQASPEKEPRPSPVQHEPIMVPKETVAEGHCSKIGQSGRGPKRHQASPEKEPLPQYLHLEPAIEGPLVAGPPVFRPKSPSQLSTSSESDVFVDCEEEISLVRSSPPKASVETDSRMVNDEVVPRKQLAAGPVYATQNSTLYSTCTSSSPENSERRMYSTKTNQTEEKPATSFTKEVAFSNVTIADMLPKRMSDTKVSSEAPTQSDMSSDSISVSGLPFDPLPLATESMVADDSACPKCDKKYKYKRPLMKHVQLCQGPGISEESPLPNHTCPTCGKIYKKIGNLEVHMNSCNPESSNFQAARAPNQEVEDEKPRGILVPFPRDNARSSSGKPICEACRSQFQSKRQLERHIKSECTILRAQGSHGRTDRNQPGTSLALSFKEPMSASDFDSSDIESQNETTSSTFATTFDKHEQNIVRAEKQDTRSDISGMDCGVRKGSLAEQLELVYGQHSKYHTPTDTMLDASPNVMKNSTLNDYSRTNRIKSFYDSDMDMSPTPQPKSHEVGNRFKLISTVSSRRPSARFEISPDSELSVCGETPASVSRVLVLDSSLSELPDTKPQPTSRKLFSCASGITDVLSPFPKVQDYQFGKGLDLDFPPLPTCPPARKASVTHRKRPTKGLGFDHNKQEYFGSEVVTIECPTQVVSDDIIICLREFKDTNVGRQIVSASCEDGLTVKITVRPDFDITEVKFDKLPGVLAKFGERSFMFVQTSPEKSRVRMGKDTGGKRELELGTPDEKPTKRRRGWNLKKGNKKKIAIAATPGSDHEQF
ncbi:hypothetical protein V494_07284 [Pseudogymnoascus sp. VKM F-4513 (FW-928)]|nr:hypothetical protein V494_07284 [Pseudogymnoascus sp. VKM F-4513 (FW-928)]